MGPFARLETEYRPVVAMLRDAGMIGDCTETEAYMRVAAERYRLRTHAWSDDVLKQVLDSVGLGRAWRRPSSFGHHARCST